MFKVSSLLLLILLLYEQRCSSAPITAKIVQSSVAAEDPGPEDLAPVTEDHSHFIEEKESLEEKLILPVADEAAAFPEESPTAEERDILKEPEPVFTGDQVSEDDPGEVLQESAPLEPLVAAPHQTSEEEPVPVEAVFAETFPDENTDVAVEGESPQEHHVEDPALEAPIPVIPLETFENEIPSKSAEEESVPEEPLLIVPDNKMSTEEEEEEEEEPPHLTAEEVKSVVLVPVELETVKTDQENEEGNTASEEPLPRTLEEEEAVSLFPIELDGQEEPTAEESAPEEPAVIIPMEPTDEVDQEEEETVHIILSETNEEAPEEHAEEEEFVVLEENAASEEPLPRTSEEGEAVSLFPIELDHQEEHPAEEMAPEESFPEEPAVIIPTDEELDQEEIIHIIEFDGQEEPTAEESAPGEASPEEPAVIVPMEPTDEEIDQEEETVHIILSETKEESPEEHAEEDKLLVLEENTASEEPLPRTLEEEEAISLFPIELDGQEEPPAEETAPGASSPEEPAVIIPVEPTDEDLDQEEIIHIIELDGQEEPTAEESAPEEPAVIIPMEPTDEEIGEEEEETVHTIFSETKEESPEEHEEELVVLEENTASEEEEAISLFPIELDGHEEPPAEETAPGESSPEEPAVIIPVEPTDQKTAQEDQGNQETVQAILSETKEEELEENTAGEESLEEASAPEDQAVIVPLDPAEEELELNEQVVSPEAQNKGITDDYTQVEAAAVPVPEDAEQDLDIEEERLPDTLEEEESVIFVYEEIDIEEENQGEPTADESALIVLEATSEEPAAEYPVIIIPIEEEEEEILVLNEDTTLQLEEGESDVILVTSQKELDVYVAALEPATAPDLALTEAETIRPAAEDNNGTSMKTHGEGIEIAAILLEEEPLALVNRGAVLGAAFFTLMSFITIGFVWTTVSKKLR